MIHIGKHTVNHEQMEQIVMGMRNPMNSWDKSDSEWNINKNSLVKRPSRTHRTVFHDLNNFIADEHEFLPNSIGPHDSSLMSKLSRAGSEHRKYARMMTVVVDITAPLYWWKEFDTYKIGTVSNSCSTMHKIHDKEFTLDDFSYEKLLTAGDKEVLLGDYIPKNVLQHVVLVLNRYRNKYITTKDELYWWQMIQLLPSSYNQKRTLFITYETLINIYNQRRKHRLDEWIEFCHWIEALPYYDIVINSK